MKMIAVDALHHMDGLSDDMSCADDLLRQVMLAMRVLQLEQQRIKLQ